MKKPNNPIIGFAGMTHLGINSAVATAERGFKVICFDANADLIRNLTKQELPIIEPDLPELLSKNKNNITFSDQPNFLRQCDIIYISIDVPTDDSAKSNLLPVHELLESVSDQMKENAILVILCQVPPGFSRDALFHLKQMKSRQESTCVSDQQLYYQVETLIFGRAIEGAMYPERFIIGCANPEEPLPLGYQTLLEAFHCPILPMRYESAELSKIAINCCLVSSIGVANTLSEICEKIGADWSEIVPALKLDKRIGQFSYLAPGLGLAGGNLERDLATVIALSENHGTHSDIVKAWIDNSRHQKDWVLKILHQVVLAKQNVSEKQHVKKSNLVIAVLGLAYKENTHSIKNSASVALLKSLKPYEVQAYDPAVAAKNIPSLSFVKDKETALEAAEDSDVLIIMTPWSEFRHLNLADLAKVMKGRIIIDPYRVLDGKLLKAHNFHYYCLGTHALC